MTRRRRSRKKPAGAPAQDPNGAGVPEGSGAAKGSGAGGAKTEAKAPAASPTPTRREVSAGGVVYRRDGDDVEILLAARRTRRGDLAWGLAKGGIEPDESTEDAAVREVREETGIDAEIEESLGDTRYFYVWDEVRVRKVVHFYLMRATGGDTTDRDDEMEDVQWFPLDRALKRAAYRGERDVLSRAAKRLR
jgi:8-oxo-dGTP pyrophosphatase MutT (NUDIX family)